MNSKATSEALFVAAGGGGDALAAEMVASALGIKPRAIATFAWERKLFDPVPGPRSAEDFEGLRSVGDHNWQVRNETRLIAGKSFLPDLARALSSPIFLLDPVRGADGLSRQLTELKRITRTRRVFIVDVGGDVLAEGDEQGLASPLADALALAAVRGLDGSAVLTLGLGLDGELAGAEWRRVCRRGEKAGWAKHTRLPESVAKRYRRHLRWHPTEATGLACLAALGYRGIAEVRGRGSRVKLDASSALIHTFDYDRVLERNRIAQEMSHTSSLRAAEATVRLFHLQSEIDIERAVLERRAARQRHDHRAFDYFALEKTLVDYSEAAAERGVKYLTIRRLAEVLGLRSAKMPQFQRFLQRRHRARLEVPVWDCQPTRNDLGRRGLLVARRSTLAPTEPSRTDISSARAR